MRWNLLLALLAASWGVIAVLVAGLDLAAPALAFLRMALAAATLVAVALLARRPGLLAPGGRLGGLVLLGVVQAAHWLLFFEAAKRGSVALAVLTFYAAPVLIAVVAPFVLPERRSGVVLGALAAGGVGIVLVALDGGLEGGAASADALLCGLGSAATYALLVLISKHLLQAQVHPLTVAAWDCAVGAVVLAPVALAVGRVRPETAEEWGAVLLLGIVLTGLSTLAYAALLRHVSAQSAGILTFLEPVSGTLLAWWLLDQRPGAATAVGAVLVLAAGVTVVVAGPDGTGASEAAGPVGSAP